MDLDYLENRFWYDKSWGDDVDSYYHDSEKNKLYVATSSAYGIGGVYELDLREIKQRMIFPESKKKLKESQDKKTNYSILSFESGLLKIQTSSKKYIFDIFFDA